MKRAVILFTRLPVPGQTKTRMMPYLNGRECAALHLSILKEEARVMKKLSADLFLCYCGSKKADAAKDWFQKQLGKEFACFPQEGESLGERMFQGLSHVLGLGYDACLLMGSDIPTIKEGDLEKAFCILKEKDLVFGPSEDGGYYLVGMKKPCWEVFHNQTYSHSQVLNNALKAAGAAGLSWGFTTIITDVDRPEDLRQLARDYREGRVEFDKDSRLAGFLQHHEKISVIVPIYNEEKTIGLLQDQLRPYLDSCEILLVDGGSRDGTLDLIQKGFQLLHAPKGRANQMNYGAGKCSGDILFFLHSDSQLPPSFLREIKEVMRTHEAGCFGIRFHSRNFFMWTCGIMSNIRARFGKIMFGDQGIFIRRDLFFALGGFPNMPVMEDYQFSLNLKKKKIDMGMTRHPIFTSDRRFPKGTIPKLKLMGQMHVLRWRYRHGQCLEDIARAYKDIR